MPPGFKPPARSGRPQGRRPERPSPDRREPKLGPGGTPEVALVRRGVERWQAGHPWIYRADLDGDPGLSGPSVVRVVDGRGWFLGKALYSKHSKIALRLLSWDDVAVDDAFFRERIARADELRQRALPGETTYRVIHGEADLLPGLVVDRYGDYLSLQLLHGAPRSGRRSSSSCSSSASSRRGS